MKSKSLRVLVACECSQTVCKAFRALGDECYSCDIEDQYGGHPEWHVKRNVLDMLNGDIAFTTQDGTDHYVFAWDLIIAHPPCTYLSQAQNKFYNKEKWGADYVQGRTRCRESAVRFFSALHAPGLPVCNRKPARIHEPPLSTDAGDTALLVRRCGEKGNMPMVARTTTTRTNKNCGNPAAKNVPRLQLYVGVVL